MSTASNPIQNEDFTAAASAVATPAPVDPVGASDPVPTDRYLTSEDVAATKAAAPATPVPVEKVPAATPPAAAPVEAKTTTPAPAGAPPEDRWDKILDNARKKARAEVEGEYAWVKDLNRDDVEATRQWISLGNQSPLLALDHLVQGIIKTNPAQRGQIERYFTSLFGGAPVAAPPAVTSAAAAKAPADDPMPEPDIPTDASNGKPVVYSAERMLERDKWLVRQIKRDVMTDVDKDLAPIRTERAKRAADVQAEEVSNRAVGAISGLPGYEENKEAIALAYAAIPNSDTSRTEGEKLRDAYLQVISTKMQEMTTRATEDASRAAIDSVHRRASATTVDPSRQPSGAPFDYSKATWEQALRHEFNSAALGR